MAIAVIDPGHGGKSEVGGSSPNNAVGPGGLLEKDLTLDLARRVRSVLAREGVDVRLTRDADTNIGLRERAGLARKAGADAFVSIHFNGFNGKAQGTETWHHSAASSDSQALALLVQTAVRKATGLDDRKVKARGFGVLHPQSHAKDTAACLVEVSFMDVAAEEARLRLDAYKDKVAAALAGAIKGWLVADGRMAGPAPRVESTAAPGRAAPEDGYEAGRLPDGQDGQDRGGDGMAQPTVQDRPAPGPAARRGELSAGVTFIGDPRAPAADAAAGIKLDPMLRGWRTNRLLPGTAGDVHVEAAVGRDESLDAAFLELLARHRRAVGIIRTGGVNYKGEHAEAWSGTGSLVAPNILLTNHHVLNSPQVAAAAEVAFDFEVSVQDLANGRKTPPAPGRSFRLQPEQLFVTSPTVGGLDYTFVWIDAAQAAGVAPLRMERAAFVIAEGEKAFIIHHPNWKPKQVSLDDADVVAAPPEGPLIHYTSDTERGSSGALVFDRSGRIIALHHASRENREQLRTPDGLVPDAVNEGIKLAAIALDLEARRAHDATAMIDLVLGEIYGSDTLAGFFGAAGRQADAGQDSATRVAGLYQASEQDIDVGFWNLAPFTSFAAGDAAQAGETAAMLVDLGLDLWVLGGAAPATAAALVEAIERKFGLALRCLSLPPGAPAAGQTVAVLWNPETVESAPLAWPPGIAQLFALRGEDFATPGQAAYVPGPAPGPIFSRQPALLQVRGRGSLAFNLVPVDPGEGDAVRRSLAAHILARAAGEMIVRHGASQDWVLGGGFDAASANAGFAILAGTGYTPAAAQDEAGGAIGYLKSPGSSVGPAFLSPNVSRLYGPQDVFIVAREKSQVDYLKRFGEHRPLLLRLSARTAGAAPEAHTGPALGEHIDAALRRVLG